VDLLVRMGSNPIPGALILVLNARANCLISSVVAVAISESFFKLYGVHVSFCSRFLKVNRSAFSEVFLSHDTIDNSSVESKRMETL
jgi:hypothetical protein